MHISSSVHQSRQLNLNFITTTNSLSIDLSVSIQYNDVKYHFMADIYFKKLGKTQIHCYSLEIELLSHFSCVRPHRRQPTRLRHPWDSPGKNTRVGCHFLLQCMKVKSENEVSQLSLTLIDTKDCRLPGSSVHGIFQARVLGWMHCLLLNSSKTNQIEVQQLKLVFKKSLHGLNS